MHRPSSLVDRARAWIDGDPDPATRAELEGLLAAGRHDTLAERMDGVLEFGTAGIRGAVEAGSNRMNRAVVIKTTAGLASFLSTHRSGPVVVGFDGRTSSEQFAADTVGVLVAAGIEVAYFRHPVPTPIAAFAARDMGAGAAVVVTASHNPPADNGYKVYDSNGAQIIPPVDQSIAAAIAATGFATDVPRVEGVFDGASSLANPLDPETVYQRYRRQVEAVVPGTGRTSGLKIAYTPIHGVGWEHVRRLMTDGGFGSVEAVESQRDPDGVFPTVSFPNPEEPGAMDEVMTLGTEMKADLVIANDPDADRLAVALPDGSGGWRPLTGNQVGVLLGDWLLERWSGHERAIVVNSIVSSPMLAEVARLHDAHFEQTLTGFKWIANAALQLEAAGEGVFVFGYEEALGYSVGPVVRDKDGISAILAFARMADSLAEDGSDVAQRLDHLSRRAGLWVSTQLSVVRPGSEGLAEIAAAMDRLAHDVPSEVDGMAVTGSTDYRCGAGDRPPWLASTPLVALQLAGSGRVLIRPSGTEPKLKIYVDLTDEPGEDLAAAEAALSRRAEALASATAAVIGL